jgi:alpha-L-rhamnosidase
VNPSRSDRRPTVASPLRPVGLTTERQFEPLGLDDEQPLLGWRLEGDGRGRAQTGWQVVVAAEADPVAEGGAPAADVAAPLWDSGWQQGAECVDVPYAGPALAPCTRYVWRVRVADEKGARSAWSEPAAFETGLAPGRPDANTAFAAAWITAPGEAESAALPDLDTFDGEHDIHRIRAVPWAVADDAADSAEPGAGTGASVAAGSAPAPTPAAERCTVFRTRFPVRDTAVPSRARLLAAAPGTVEAVLNGVAVSCDGRPSAELAGAFARAEGGQHVLVVRVRTDGGAEPCLVAALTDGSPRTRPGPTVPHAAATGDHWQARPADPGEPAERWADPRQDTADGTGTGTGTGTGADTAQGTGPGTGTAHRTEWPRAVADGRNGDAPHGRAPATHRPSPCLRRDFELPAPVVRARLYASAFGLYELRLNGARVGTEELAPGWTDYDHRVTYRAHDVTGRLTEGPNTLAALLADGWYTGNVCIFGNRHYGAVRALAALLVVDHPDGSRTTLATAPDGRWQTATGAVRYADLQNGEVHDARLEQPGWDTPGFDATGWDAAVAAPTGEPAVLAALTPPVRAQHEIPATALTALPGGRLLADFGENLAGRVRIDVRGPAGARVLLRHAEALRHDGEPYTDNLRTARATDEYVLRGDEDGETWQPRFTTHGFQYCEITALPPADGSGPAPEVRSATAVALWADMPATGTFTSSHAGLNTLHGNIGRSLRGNFLAVPTDCPQRDERMGWTGDIQVFAPTAAFHHDIRGFLRGWLRELRGAQHPGGAVPHTVPDMFRRALPAAEIADAGGAAGWGDAAVTVPAALLAAYDDRRSAAEALDSVAAWLDHLERAGTDGISPAGGFGDWLALTDTPTDLVATAYHAYAARAAAALAAAIGRTDLDARWSRTYRRVRAAFRARWVGGGGVLHPGTQTAYVLALHIGLLDPQEVPAAADRLADEVASRGHHLTTGFLGTPWLLDALTDAGRIDTAHRLLLQESYPSWLYPVSTGATTIWERWNSWSDSTGFADASMTSFNHYAYGAVGDWVHRTVGGLAPAAPGYRRVLVAPRPPQEVTSAETSLRTAYGTVSVGWRRTAEGFTLDVDLPPGVGAELRLPELPSVKGMLTESGEPAESAEGVRVLPPLPGCAAVLETGSGSYRFTLT